jgi:hypothetical protein
MRRILKNMQVFDLWQGENRLYALLFNIAFVVLGVLILIGPAVRNGFPILHSDSGTYLLEGFQNKIPVSRPITYCLFVRFTSYIFSLWSVIIAQAIIVYWMIWLTVNTIIGKRDIAWLPFMVVAILSATTGLAYYVSQIMPDIFLSIAIMAIFVLTQRGKLPVITLIMISLLLWISLIVHLSNLPIITAVSIALLALMVYFQKTFLKKIFRNIAVLFFVLLISWLTNPYLSYSYGEGFQMSNSGNIVFFSRLLQAGAAQQYIKDKCKEDDKYYLCKYLDEIDNYNRLDVFLWSDTSFLYDHPCKEKAWDNCWRERNKEFGIVNSAILSHPASRAIYVKAVWNDFLLQLRSFELTSYISFSAGSHIEYPMKKYYPGDYSSFTNSRQYHGSLNFPQQSLIIRWTVIFSLIIIIGLIIKNKMYFRISAPIFYLILIFLMNWLVNAALTTTFAVGSNRFLGRFIWLLPLMVITLLYREYSLRNKAV